MGGSGVRCWKEVQANRYPKLGKKVAVHVKGQLFGIPQLHSQVDHGDRQPQPGESPSPRQHASDSSKKKFVNLQFGGRIPTMWNVEKWQS